MKTERKEKSKETEHFSSWEGGKPGRVSKSGVQTENDPDKLINIMQFRIPKADNHIYTNPPLTLPSRKSHTLLNLLNRLPRVQSLGTGPAAIHNRMAPVQRHAVIQHTLPLLLVLIPGISQPAVRLQQDGRTQVFLAVPPVRGARGGAAGAEDTFVEAVEAFAVCGGLSVFAALSERNLVSECGRKARKNMKRDVHLQTWSRAGGRV